MRFTVPRARRLGGRGRAPGGPGGRCVLFGRNCLLRLCGGCGLVVLLFWRCLAFLWLWALDVVRGYLKGNRFAIEWGSKTSQMLELMVSEGQGALTIGPLLFNFPCTTDRALKKDLIETYYVRSLILGFTSLVFRVLSPGYTVADRFCSSKEGVFLLLRRGSRGSLRGCTAGIANCSLLSGGR
jgi:hypothetical protein